ncbi:protein eva-1 homolog B-like [Hypanus sabinus]|uniref:protein eva-1 homolog B-like n=1 Tax=Hypanus sabinus TaxID=79690 RepID=UPI0028C4FB06|nr:protein eva-1 homolog B-like [Hypanus sabinus]XP_059810303.1 protein eva-1 homolog B-like [Hypanus sabinus]XP_059810304.1 protein eva-1 homolog B-like [Hypanus sabinus]XP_059810305.1 protein eva-1 homolog B-like [Hypanus sabinus]
MDIPKAEMSLITNSIQAYMHIASNPEKAALYFITGVCFGLILTLCLLVIRISCHARTVATDPVSRKEEDGSEEEDEEEDEDEEVDSGLPAATDLALVNHNQATTSSSVNVFTSAEELERAQLLEERERIIREIWRSGQPDILGSGWHQFEMEMLPNGVQREHQTWSPNSHGKY